MTGDEGEPLDAWGWRGALQRARRQGDRGRASPSPGQQHFNYFSHFQIFTFFNSTDLVASWYHGLNFLMTSLLIMEEEVPKTTLYCTMMPKFSFWVGSWTRVEEARLVSSCFSCPSRAGQGYMGHILKSRHPTCSAGQRYLLQWFWNIYQGPICPCYCSGAASIRTPEKVKHWISDGFQRNDQKWKRVHPVYYSYLAQGRSWAKREAIFRFLENKQLKCIIVIQTDGSVRINEESLHEMNRGTFSSTVHLYWAVENRQMSANCRTDT